MFSSLPHYELIGKNNQNYCHQNRSFDLFIQLNSSCCGPASFISNIQSLQPRLKMGIFTTLH